MKRVEILTVSNDRRHEVSNEVIKVLKPVMYSQDDFGINKYGKPLNHDMDYDWLQMWLEEQADGMKYIVNEMKRKELVKLQLQYAIEEQNWSVVKAALELLSKTGTGNKKNPSK